MSGQPPPPVNPNYPVYQQQQQQPPPAFGQQQAPPQLTKEEREILGKCNSEAYWYRCLPFSGILGTLTGMGVRNGILSASPRYGAGPKIIVAITVGYFVGKFSYAEACADKILKEAPRTNLGAMIRKRRGLPPLEDDGSNSAPSSGFGVPLQQPSQPAIEYGYQPETPETGASPGQVTSYDELRRRNRAQQQQQQQPPIPQPPQPVQPSQSQEFSYQPEGLEGNPATSVQSYEELRRRNRGGAPANPPPAYPPPPQPTNPALYTPPTQPRSKNAYGDEGFE